MTLNSNLWCVNLPVPYLYIMKILTQKISRGGVSTLKPQNLSYLNSLHFIFPITIYNYIHRLLRTCGSQLQCRGRSNGVVFPFRLESFAKSASLPQDGLVCVPCTYNDAEVTMLKASPCYWNIFPWQVFTLSEPVSEWSVNYYKIKGCLVCFSSEC